MLPGVNPQTYYGKPLVLLPDWVQNLESVWSNSGFSEAAADAFFTSLVGFNQQLGNDALFNSPMHFIGFSRGTVVNSEIIQRLGTFFPEDTNPNKFPDLQMTTVDPHDFNQPSLPPLVEDFFDPKVQVWENVTFADNYYQTVTIIDGPNVFPPVITPGGRDIPNLPPPDANGTAPGLRFPREGWIPPNPDDPDADLLGEPNLSVLLGTRANENGREHSRAGFTKDDLFGRPHVRSLAWYAGTVDLAEEEYPLDDITQSRYPIYRRRGDGRIPDLFERIFPSVMPISVSILGTYQITLLDFLLMIRTLHQRASALAGSIQYLAVAIICVHSQFHQ